MDVTDLILNDHHEQRRMFALLDDLGDERDALTAVWRRLKVLLEVHAEAEEEVFYPELLRIGTGAGGKDSAAAEVRDVIKDHNEIRDAVAAVEACDVGSEGWWRAVVKARAANSDHMAEEERQDLADFRRHADPALRHRLAVGFVTFESQHAQGVTARDRDPSAYVQEHG